MDDNRMALIAVESPPNQTVPHLNQAQTTHLDENGYTQFHTADIIFFIYYYGFFLVLSLVNFIGNGLIIHSVRRHRKLLVPGNYFIVSQACSDLCLGVVYPIYNVSHMEVEQIENTIGLWGSCTVIITLTLGMLNVSSYNLVGITISRYISIRDPLKFPYRVTHTRAVMAVAAVWVSCMALAIGLYTRFVPPDNYRWCRYETVLHSQPMHVILTSIVSMILPLSIMTALYFHMALIARKQARAILCQARRTSSDSLRGSLLRHELKMFRVAGTLLGYFTFAWAPFVVFEFMSVVHQQQVDRYVRATVRIILHSNSSVNAFIYAGRLSEFRDAMRREASCVPCLRSSRTMSDDNMAATGRTGYNRRQNNSQIIAETRVEPLNVENDRNSLCEDKGNSKVDNDVIMTEMDNHDSVPATVEQVSSQVLEN